MLTVTEGKVIYGKIKVQLAPKIERGQLDGVNGLVMHQTGGSDADSTLAAYKNGGNGAHFLIGKDGTIYQTARVNQRTFHVGNIRSRCHSIDSCSVDDATEIKTILKGKGTYSKKVQRISDLEKAKAYPARYPTSSDSLGIEVVGKLDGKSYEDATAEQGASVKWLVAELLAFYNLTTADVYRHSEVSYKHPTEAKNVKW